MFVVNFFQTMYYDDYSRYVLSALYSGSANDAYLDLYYSGYQKSSSNNCLLKYIFSLQVSPSVLTVEDCSAKEYRFSLTPTIPVAMSPHTGNYLEISFYLPPNIQMQQCIVELRDKKNVSVRVIAQCTNSKKPASKIDKVIVPEIRGTHSMFWNRDMHLPGVWVRPTFRNFTL